MLKDFKDVFLTESILFGSDETSDDLAPIVEDRAMGFGEYTFDFKTQYPTDIPASIDASYLYKGFTYDTSMEHIYSDPISHGSTTNSYIKFTAKKYETVSLKAKVSSESNWDWGFAHVTTSSSVPLYNTTTNRFVYISGYATSSSVTNWTTYSYIIPADGTYYLHLGYRKDGSGSSGSDKIYFKDISIPAEQLPVEGFGTFNLKETIRTGTEKPGDSSLILKEDIRRVVEYTFDFKEQYPTDVPSSIDISELYRGFTCDTANNYIQNYVTDHSSTSSSCIKFEAQANQEISLSAWVYSEENYDWAFAHVTTDYYTPSHDETTGRFVHISGFVNWTTYTYTIPASGTYYLHLGYSKDSGTSSSYDKVCIRDIRLPGSAPSSFDNSFNLLETIRTGTEAKGDASLTLVEDADKTVYTRELFTLKEDIRRDSSYTFDFSTERPLNVPSTIDISELFKGFSCNPDNKYLYNAFTYYINTSKIAFSAKTGDIISLKARLTTHVAYAHVTVASTAPSYSVTDGRIFYLAGEVDWETYTYTIPADGRYYLYMNYYLNDSINTSEDKVYITDIKVPNGLVEESTGFNNAFNLKESILVNANDPKGSANLALIEDADITAWGTKCLDLKEDVRRVPQFIFDFSTDSVAKVPSYIDTWGLFREFTCDTTEKYIHSGTTAHNGSKNANIGFKAKEGDVISLRAKISSENNYDCGFAHVITSSDAPLYSDTTNRFVYISGEVDWREYTYVIPYDGRFYLHLGYHKDVSGVSGDDKVYFTDIKLPKDELPKSYNNSFVLNENVGDAQYGHETIELKEDVTVQTGSDVFNISEDIRRMPTYTTYTYNCSQRYPAAMPNDLDVTYLDLSGVFYTNQYIKYSVSTAREVSEGYITFTTEEDDSEITVDYECNIPAHGLGALYCAIEIDGTRVSYQTVSVTKKETLKIVKKGSHKVAFRTLCGTTGYPAQFYVKSFSFPVINRDDKDGFNALSSKEIISPSPLDSRGYSLLTLNESPFAGDEGFELFTLKEDVRRAASYYHYDPGLDSSGLPDSITNRLFSNNYAFIENNTFKVILAGQKNATGSITFETYAPNELFSIDASMLKSPSTASGNAYFTLDGYSISLATTNYKIAEPGTHKFEYQVICNTTAASVILTINSIDIPYLENLSHDALFNLSEKVELSGLEPSGYKTLLLQEKIAISVQTNLPLKEKIGIRGSSLLDFSETIRANANSKLNLLQEVKAAGLEKLPLEERAICLGFDTILLKERAIYLDFDTINLKELVYVFNNLPIKEKVVYSAFKSLPLSELTKGARFEALNLKEWVYVFNLLELEERITCSESSDLLLKELAKATHFGALSLEEKVYALDSLTLKEKIAYLGSNDLSLKQFVIGTQIDKLNLKEFVYVFENLTLKERAVRLGFEELTVKELIKGEHFNKLTLKDQIYAKDYSKLSTEEKICAKDTDIIELSEAILGLNSKTLTLKERAIVNNSALFALREEIINKQGYCTLDLKESAYGSNTAQLKLLDKAVVDGQDLILLKELIESKSDKKLIDLCEHISASGASEINLKEHVAMSILKQLPLKEFIKQLGIQDVYLVEHVRNPYITLIENVSSSYKVRLLSANKSIVLTNRKGPQL